MVNVIISLVNALGSLWQKAGFTFPRLEEEELLNSAMKRTGLKNYGDRFFQIGLKNLLHDNDLDQISVIGRIFMKQMILNALKNRLMIQSHLDKHPEILQEPGCCLLMNREPSVEIGVSQSIQPLIMTSSKLSLAPGRELSSPIKVMKCSAQHWMP